jgi:hypothetical protein
MWTVVTTGICVVLLIFLGGAEFWWRLDKRRGCIQTPPPSEDSELNLPTTNISMNT